MLLTEYNRSANNQGNEAETEALCTPKTKQRLDAYTPTHHGAVNTNTTEGRDQAEPNNNNGESSFFQTSVQTSIKRTDSDEASTASRCTRSCNYDVNPTELFLDLKKRDWTTVIKRCLDDPDQARVWVSRNEADGHTLRWKLLPIHAAIIFDASEGVVQAILEAYPKGAQSRDDQGMLPIHLAFRNGASVPVVNLLLAAFPQSPLVEDKKGRTPVALARASTSPNREAYIKALDCGPTYQAVAAAASERAAVIAEQSAIFNGKVTEAEKKHTAEIDELKEENSKLQAALSDIQAELEKSEAATKVLLQLSNNLEAQITNISESESFLAKKVEALECNLTELTDHKSRTEAAMQAEVEKLEKEIQVLQLHQKRSV